MVNKTNLWDAMPTICEIVGIKPPHNINGISFLPTLLGHASQQKTHPYLYWEFPAPAYGGQQAVRMGKWKGIRSGITKGDLNIQLFNLDEDIREQHDVASQHPDIVERMMQIMKAEHTTPEVASFEMEALEKDVE